MPENTRDPHERQRRRPIYRDPRFQAVAVALVLSAALMFVATALVGGPLAGITALGVLSILLVRRFGHRCWHARQQIPAPSLDRNQAQAITLSLVLAVSLFAGAAAFSTPAVAADNSTAEHTEGFEDGDLEGWTHDGSIQISDTTVAEGQFSAEFYQDSSDHGGLPVWDPSNVQVGNVSYFYQAEELPSASGEVHRVDIDAGSNDNIVQIRVKPDGGVAYYNGAESDTGITVDKSQWYEFVAYNIDYSAETFDFKVYDKGGNLVGNESGIAFTSSPSSSDFDSIGIGSSDGSDFFVDSIQIGGTDSPTQFTETITGQVQTSEGNPVSNATLVSHSITEPALDKSDARSLQRQAEDLRSELTNPLPSGWDPDYDLTSHYQDANANYLLVHESEDWGIGTSTIVSSSIDEPRLQVDSDQQVTLSLWDPTDNPRIGNQITNSYPGSPDDGTIVIEQKGPTGETTDRRELDTRTIAKTSGANPASTLEYPGVRTSLPTGVYVAYPEGARERGYTFVVGSADQLASAWESQLRNEAGQLTDRANRIRNLLSQDHVTRSTARTDENGSFNIDVPSNAVTTDLKAMKADGELLQTIENPENASLEDLRKFQTQGFNGTFYLPSPEPNTVEPPAENVTVTTYRSPEVPLGDMSSFADLMSFLDKQRLNETVDELRSEYDQQLSELERSSAERIYTDHRTLTETVPGAQERYLERSDFDELQAAEDLSQEELTTETRHMQTALAGIGELEPPDPGDISAPEVGEDGIDFTYPLPDSVDPDSVAPEIHWSDGTVEPIGEDYYSVESAGIAGQNQQLVISELPIDDSDPAAFDIRVRGASSEGSLLPGGANGGLLDDRVSGMNPAAAGAAPQINAVDFSTLAPGPSESVSVGTLPAEDTGYDQLVAASAWNDDGTEINATVNSERDRASFRTDGQGTHTVQLTYQNQQGDRFVVAERVDAKQQSRSDPATVRASGSPNAMTGIYAVTGESLNGARLEQNGGTLSITAIAEDSDGPGELNIKPSNVMEGTTHTVDLEVVHGSSETAVSSNIPVNVHLTSPRDTALYWRSEPGIGGEPITHGGETRFGSVSKPSGDKHIVHTYTNSDGSVTISTVEVAGPIDRVSHQVSQWVGNIPFAGAILGMSLADFAGRTLLILVVAGTLKRRDSQYISVIRRFW